MQNNHQNFIAENNSQDNEIKDSDDLSSFACANYIIEKLNKRKVNDLTNLKLQKLLYCAYGIHLSVFEERLFNDEIQAWKLGPVVPSVYKEFKDCGSKPIGVNSLARILKPDFSGQTYPPTIDDSQREDENRAKSLLISCAMYGYKTAWDLVEMLHNKNSAWEKNYREGIWGVRIPDEDIRREFEGSIDKIITLTLG